MKECKHSLKERVDRVMKGASLEDAEKIGIDILAQMMARHVYLDGDGEEYFSGLMKRIALEADKWAKDHALELATCKALKEDRK